MTTNTPAVSGTDRYAHRRTRTELRVIGHDGVPLVDQDVTVTQLRHAFGFGCTAPDMTPAGELLRRQWLDLFDTATLAFYWGRYESAPGKTDRERVTHTAQWLFDRGVRLKGHPLVWHTVKAPWVDRLSLADAERALRGRIRREVNDFAGLINTWDAINEAVIMPRFINEPDGIANAITRLCAEKGRIDMVSLAFDEARSMGTNPTLVINDFDLGPEYEQLVEDLLAAGVRIDAIGLQSHMHQGFRGEDQLVEICDRFTRFGIPLHWTETTLVSGDLMPGEIGDLNDFVVAEWPTTPAGEQRQADEIVRHYQTLVAHPAVESITYWGFDDAGAWLGAPSGFVRRDGTLKPSYESLRSLIRGEWWLGPTVLHTDAEGCVVVEAFAGLFEVSAAGASESVDLAAGSATSVVTLHPPRTARG